MNVLIFTTTILMLLAMMTMARLQIYISFTAIQSQFEAYMAHSVENYVNKEAKKRYDATAVSQKDFDTEKQKQQAGGSSKLSIKVFVTEKDKNSLLFAQTSLIFQNLVKTLYTGQPFFDEIISENPSVLDELIARIIQEANALPKEQKIEEPKGLANLNLKDEKLQSFLYKMLHGNPSPGGQEDKYESLLNYLTMAQKTQIRIYLAPYNLLRAIFGSTAVVDEIIASRQNLYDLVDDEQITAEEATATFRDQFLTQRLPNIADTFLDFTVTKTNPKDYKNP